jgi:cell volume regulation protein A
MTHLSVETLLGLVGLVIFVGLAGELFFKKTGVPSALFLIGLGVILGPVSGLIDSRHATALAPYFGTLALLIILFDGGLNLQLDRVLRQGPIAFAFTLSVFIGTAGAIAVFYVLVLQGTWMEGLLLGAILGGTTPVIVMPIALQLSSISEQTKVVLSLESALADVFVIVSALTIVQGLSGPGNFDHLYGIIFNQFVTAFFLALVAGVVWIRVMAWLEGQALGYMLTLAAILVLYDLAEFLGGSGVMAVLLFGLLLGNMESLLRCLAAPIQQMIGRELEQAGVALDTFLKRLNEELSFLVRTFFYVLLGLIFDIFSMTWLVSAIGLGFFACALGVRGILAEVFGRMWCGWTLPERRVVTAMLPRGIAVAVMSFLPISRGVPNTEFFPVYALTMIALSILYMSVMLTFERRRLATLVEAVPATSV